MFKNSGKFDERQLCMRGTVFRNTFFLMVFLLMLSIFGHQLGYGGLFPSYFKDLFILFAGCSYSVSSFAYWGLMPSQPGKRRRFALLLILALAGAAGVVLGIGEILLRDAHWTQGSQLSPQGASVVCGVLLLFPILFHALGRQKQKKEEAEE